MDGTTSRPAPASSSAQASPLRRPTSRTGPSATGATRETARCTSGLALPVPAIVRRNGRESVEEAAATAELFIAIGTSLTVYPVARLPEIALDAGARVVIVNAEPTPLDYLAHALLRGQAGEVLSALAAAAAAR